MEQGQPASLLSQPPSEQHDSSTRSCCNERGHQPSRRVQAAQRYCQMMMVFRVGIIGIGTFTGAFSVA